MEGASADAACSRTEQLLTCLLQRLVVSQEEQTFKRRMGYAAAAPEVTPYSAHGVSRTMPPT